jgi:hypothetical protein
MRASAGGFRHRNVIDSGRLFSGRITENRKLAVGLEHDGGSFREMTDTLFAQSGADGLS